MGLAALGGGPTNDRGWRPFAIREQLTSLPRSCLHHRLRNRPIVGDHHLVLRTGVEGVKSASTSIEALMAELRAASADLAKSAAIGTSRMVLRSRLSNAIRDAEKAERAAENLRAAASAIVTGHEQIGLVPDPTGDIEMERADT